MARNTCQSVYVCHILVNCHRPCQYPVYKHTTDYQRGVEMWGMEQSGLLMDKIIPGSRRQCSMTSDPSNVLSLPSRTASPPSASSSSTTVPAKEDSRHSLRRQGVGRGTEPLPVEEGHIEG